LRGKKSCDMIRDRKATYHRHDVKLDFAAVATMI
jgi:hypothetical protein